MKTLPSEVVLRTEDLNNDYVVGMSILGYTSRLFVVSVCHKRRGIIKFIRIMRTLPEAEVCYDYLLKNYILDTALKEI